MKLTFFLCKQQGERKKLKVGINKKPRLVGRASLKVIGYGL